MSTTTNPFSTTPFQTEAPGPLSSNEQTATVFEPELLMAEARRESGRSDFGVKCFEESLERLCDSLSNEAELNEIGKLNARSEIVDNLILRLQMADAERCQPNIYSTDVGSPAVIFGLPRTGTSILYELLALDTEAFRTPKVWEVAEPLAAQSETRLHEIDGALRAVYELAPDFKRQHRIGATLGEECCRLLQLSFAGYRYMWAYRVPSFWRWSLAADLSGAYGWHRKMLQILQPGGSDRTWMLKSPGNLPFIGAMRSAYPGLREIHTYRDPADVIGSSTSMIATLRSVFSDSVDAHEIAAEQIDFWKIAIQSYIELRRSSENYRALDLSYANYLARPLEGIERVRDFLGLEFTASQSAAVENHLRAHPQNEHGAHRYSVEDFGFSRTQIHKLFEDYIETFHVEVKARP